MKDKTVVAYLVRPAEGGIKSHLLTLLSGLDKTRFEPVLICPQSTSLYAEAEAAGYRVVPLEIVGELNPKKDWQAVKELRRILHRTKPDILHIHSAKAGLIGRLAVLFIKRPKVVLTFHSFVFDERVGKRRRVLISWIERRLLAVTDRILAVSKALKIELRSKMGLRDDMITVIPNGVVFSDILKPERDGTRIGTVSRLAPQKGLDIFLKSAALVHAKIPAARFVIVGDGPQKTELEMLAAELGIRDRVEFMGYRQDVISIIAGFDVFVLASTWETFGLTLVEALSQEVPVVASNVGGIPEIVDGTSTGLLAETGNPESFAEQICRLLNDKELAERLARNGCRSVRAQFGAELMVKRTQEIYNSLLTDKPNTGKKGNIDVK